MVPLRARGRSGTVGGLPGDRRGNPSPAPVVPTPGRLAYRPNKGGGVTSRAGAASGCSCSEEHEKAPPAADAAGGAEKSVADQWQGERYVSAQTQWPGVTILSQQISVLQQPVQW